MTADGFARLTYPASILQSCLFQVPYCNLNMSYEIWVMGYGLWDMRYEIWDMGLFRKEINF